MRETSAYNRRTQGRSLDKQAVFRLFLKNVNQQPKSLAHPHHLHLATFGDSLLSLVYCGHSMTHPAPQNSEHLWQGPSWKGVGRLAWLLSFLTDTNMKVGLKVGSCGWIFPLKLHSVSYSVAYSEKLQSICITN